MLPRATSPARSCRCTRSPARPRCTPGSCGGRWRRVSSARRPRGFSTRSTAWGARGSRPRRSQPRFYHDIHRPASLADARTAAAPAEVSTSSCACNSGSSLASVRWPRVRPASATWSTAHSSPSSTHALPFPLTADQQGRASTQIYNRTTSRRAGADAPAAAGRGRGQGQDRRAPSTALLTARCRAATKGRSWRRPRCWRSSTFELSDTCALLDELSVVPKIGSLLGRSAGARWRCSPTARRPPNDVASPTACAQATIDILVGTRTALDLRRRRVRPPRCRGHRRAAPLRRRAARPAACGKEPSSRLTCW